jgi:hypothetical protein
LASSQPRQAEVRPPDDGNSGERARRERTHGSQLVLPTPYPEVDNATDVMQVHLEIPEDLAKQLAPEPGDLTRTAIEAVALEGVRSGKLTVAQACRLLGLPSRYDMDGFLKAHGVFLDLTLDDVRRDSDAAVAFSK